MASNLYQSGLKLILDGTVDLLTDTIKVVLVNASYTPDKDHDFLSDVNTYELSGTGYAGGFAGSGRKTLASKTVGKNDSTNVANFDAADSSWTAINAGTAAYAIIGKEVTNDAASPIFACIDLNPDVATNGGDYSIAWDAAGLFTFGA